MEKNKQITLIRFISMILIFFTHVTDFYGMSVFAYLNIGTQIFFIISGFLHGQKDIDNFKKWFKNKFVYVYIPYFLFFTFSSISLMIVKDFVAIKEYWKYLLLLPGFFTKSIYFGNLWFVTFIFLCYLLVPLLQKIDFSKDKGWKFYLKLFLFLVPLMLIQYFTGLYNFTSNFFAFVFSYYMSRRYLKDRKLIVFHNKLAFIQLISLFFFPFIFIYFTFFLLNPNTYWYLFPLEYLAPFLLAINLFLIFYSISYNLIQNKKILPKLHKLISFTDKYSYGFYLAHFLFVFTSFSILKLLGYGFLAIPVAFLLSVLFSILLNFVTKKIASLI